MSMHCMIATMNVVVFGATGRVGRAFVEQALAAGHAVTAVVRDAKAAMPASAVRAKASYLPEGKGAITTGDIAAFMLEEIATPRFSRQRVGLNT